MPDRLVRLLSAAPERVRRVITGTRRTVTAMRPRTRLVAAAVLLAAVLGGGGTALALTAGHSSDGAQNVAARENDRASRDLIRDAAAATTAPTTPPATTPPVTTPPPATTKPPTTKAAPKKTQTTAPGVPAPAGVAEGCSAYTGNKLVACNLLGSFGFSTGEMSALVPLWEHESGWSTTAANSSGAYGIPQALPGSKMASAGGDWRTSAATQVSWGLSYIKGRYGSPSSAWSYWQSHGWY